MNWGDNAEILTINLLIINYSIKNFTLFFSFLIERILLPCISPSYHTHRQNFSRNYYHFDQFSTYLNLNTNWRGEKDKRKKRKTHTYTILNWWGKRNDDNRQQMMTLPNPPQCKRKKQHQQPATPPALFYLNCTSQNLYFSANWVSFQFLPWSVILGRFTFRTTTISCIPPTWINQIAPIAMIVSNEWQS